MHILILPSHLYCPPELPLLGSFQRHQAEVLARYGSKVGVASYGFIPWIYLVRPFPYEHQAREDGNIAVLRRFRRPVIPGRFASVVFRKESVVRFATLVDEYIQHFGRPDIVHAHGVFDAGVAAAAVYRSSGIPFVLTEHSSRFFTDKFSTPEVACIRETLGAAAVLTTVSSALASRVATVSSADVQSIEVIGNVLDPWLEDRALACTMLGDAPAARRETVELLTVGNLVPVKNHSLLLKAFALARSKRRGLHLRIGGDGPLRRSLRREADALGLGRSVEFLGYLSREHVVDELKRCSAFVLSSSFETFGVVLIEAMAFGKPVVSTLSGGPEEIVESDSGLLSDSDPESLADAMLRIAEMRTSPEAIRRHCLERYGGNAFAARMRSFYEKAAHG